MVPRTLILHRDRKAAEGGRELLNSSGYQSLIATGLEEALALLDAECPQVLLVPANGASPHNGVAHDSSLPATNGHKPVVAVTTFDTLDAAMTMLEGNGTRTALNQAVVHRELLLQALGL